MTVTTGLHFPELVHAGAGAEMRETPGCLLRTMAVKQAWQLGGGTWDWPTPDAQPGARKPPAMWVKAVPAGSQRLAGRSPVPELLALRQPARCSTTV